MVTYKMKGNKNTKENEYYVGVYCFNHFCGDELIVHILYKIYSHCNMVADPSQRFFSRLLIMTVFIQNTAQNQNTKRNQTKRTVHTPKSSVNWLH